MMPDHGANPVFLIKKKDWTSRTLTKPPPPTSDNILFLPYSPPKSRRHMYITPNSFIKCKVSFKTEKVCNICRNALS